MDPALPGWSQLRTGKFDREAASAAAPFRSRLGSPPCAAYRAIPVVRVRRLGADRVQGIRPRLTAEEFDEHNRAYGRLSSGHAILARLFQTCYQPLPWRIAFGNASLPKDLRWRLSYIWRRLAPHAPSIAQRLDRRQAQAFVASPATDMPCANT